MSNYDALHQSLNALADLYDVQAIVISDEEGLLIDANASCPDAEPLAAYAPHVQSGTVPPHREDRSPTMTESYTMGDFDILVSAVGTPEACKAAIQATMPHVATLVA